MSSDLQIEPQLHAWLSISPAERRRREAAVNFARANVGLEGFKLSKECEELACRFVAGEITISDLIIANKESAPC